jgi:hypothetical protein
MRPAGILKFHPHVIALFLGKQSEDSPIDCRIGTE